MWDDEHRLGFVAVPYVFVREGKRLFETRLVTVD
jgi:hypothetical protein